MNAASYDIATLLQGSEIGLTMGSDLFQAQEPDEPSTCVTVYDTPGAAPTLSFDGVVREEPRVQIRVRNKNYQDGYEMALEIYNYLNGYTGTVNGANYQGIFVSQSPFHLMQDHKNRSIFIINLNIGRWQIS